MLVLFERRGTKRRASRSYAYLTVRRETPVALHIAAHYHRAPVRARVFAFHDILGARRVHVDRGCGGTRDVGFGDEHSRRTRGREWDERSRRRDNASADSATNSVYLDAKALSRGREVVLAFCAREQ